MISAQLGRPGGGKSYEIVKYQIIPSVLNDKRKVVTNIPIQLDHIEKIHGKEYSDLIDVVEGSFHEYGLKRPFSKAEDFLKYDDWRNDKGQGALFIVDEAHLSIGRDADKALLEYLSMHRHYGHDIIVVTQSHRKLNRDLRDMVEVAYHCAKMAAYGDDTKYIRKTYHGVENMREPIHVEEREYDPAIFPYYKSHTKNDSSVTEASVKDSKALLNPFGKATKICIAIGAVIFIGSMINIFTSDSPEEKLAKLQQKQQAQPAATQPAPIPTEQVATVQQNKPEKPQPQKVEEEPLSASEKIRRQREKDSKKYHPFSKVQLHINGFYSDIATGESKVYFSASRNGQNLFELGSKDFFMAGYEVNVLGDCVVEIIYFDFRDFLTCDSPTVGIGDSAQIASNVIN